MKHTTEYASLFCPTRFVGQAKAKRCPTFPRFVAVHVGHVLCSTYRATGLDQQVIVVVHEAVGMHRPMEICYHIGQDPEKRRPVVLTEKNGLPPVSARCIIASSLEPNLLVRLPAVIVFYLLLNYFSWEMES